MSENQTIKPGGSARGTIAVSGDKSISIRAVLFSSIAEGTSHIRGIGTGGDVQSAIRCMQQLGIVIEFEGTNSIVIHGNSLRGLQAAEQPIDCGNSASTFRLLSGILAGQYRHYLLTGDVSLCQRPMERIIEPLRNMGAHIESMVQNGRAPIEIKPSYLHGISYKLPVASAQVKSAIMLSGLFAESLTTIIEPAQSRNHTELILSAQGVDVEINGRSITVKPPTRLQTLDMHIPGDISSAAFFIVLASLLPESHIIIENVGINKTRTGVLTVLERMGADITVNNCRTVGGEMTADLEVKSAPLGGTVIDGELIPRVIDEIPILTVAAALARGITTIRDARELRVKETDRIHAICANLKKMGAVVDELPDGMIITGGQRLRGAEIDSFGDHRVAMAFAVGAALADMDSLILNSAWADISFPGFFEILNRVRGYDMMQ